MNIKTVEGDEDMPKHFATVHRFSGDKGLLYLVYACGHKRLIFNDRNEANDVCEALANNLARKHGSCFLELDRCKLRIVSA